ncbi:MAG TPA: hypothetical protein VER03_14545 [Bryobacteraceae bacterium]|nr:hypothetical protein [Bryobacteraceae bacterium]
MFARTDGDYDVNQAKINGFGPLTTNQRKPKNIDYDGAYYNRDAKLARGPASNNREQVFFVLRCMNCRLAKASAFCRMRRDLLFGGWQINGTHSWMSGQPFTPSYRDCNSDRDTGWRRPDIVGNPFAMMRVNSDGSSRRKLRWLRMGRSAVLGAGRSATS